MMKANPFLTAQRSYEALWNPNGLPQKNHPLALVAANRLRLLPDQIGTTIRCPKCNATFAVGRPQAADDAVDDDAYEPEIPLKRSSIVSEDESGNSARGAGQSPQYDTDWSTEDNIEREPPHVRPLSLEPDYFEAAKEKGFIRSPESEPKPPRWTFFSGVFLFPWQGLNLTRWIAMSIGLALAGSLSIGALDLLGFLRRHASPDAVMGVPLVLLAVSMLLAGLAFSAACFLSAVQDTADGFDEPQEDTMPELGQWIFTLASIALLLSLAGALGYPFSYFEEVGPLGVLVCGVVLFPVLLLSAMESDSFIVPYSPAVLRTLVRFWWGWLMFYLMTTPLILAWLVLSGMGLARDPHQVSIVAGPALATILLIYARLLGRLAWKAAGMPDNRRETPPDESPQPGNRKKKRRKMRIAFPEDLDAAARNLAVELPGSPGPINSRRRSK